MVGSPPSDDMSATGTAAGKVRAVLWDFGGTLYEYQTLEVASREGLLQLAEWLGHTDLDGPLLMQHYRDGLLRAFTRYRGRPFYLHRDLFDSAIDGFAANLEAELDDSLRERFHRLQWKLHARDLTLRSGTFETLKTLRDLGVHVGMVSNIDDDHLEHLLAISGVGNSFDSILSSEQAGSCKPDGRFFRLALDQAGCEPEEALFVGDSLPQDIAGANAAGLRSVWIRRPGMEAPDDGPQPQHSIDAIPQVLDLLAAS